MGSVLGVSAQGIGVGGSAELLVQAAGLLNIVAGVLLVAATLAYVGGMIVWVTHLGSSPGPRDKAIDILLWVPPILFTTIVVLAVAQFVQNRPHIALYIVSLAVLAVVAWAIVQAVRSAPAHEKE